MRTRNPPFYALILYFLVKHTHTKNRSMISVSIFELQWEHRFVLIIAGDGDDDNAPLSLIPLWLWWHVWTRLLVKFANMFHVKFMLFNWIEDYSIVLYVQQHSVYCFDIILVQGMECSFSSISLLFPSTFLTASYFHHSAEIKIIKATKPVVILHV